MWAALASTLQCILLAGNPTEVHKSFLIVMEHIHHNSKEKVAPCFVVQSVSAFLLPMEYTANILHSQQNKRCLRYLRVWMKST